MKRWMIIIFGVLVIASTGVLAYGQSTLLLQEKCAEASSKFIARYGFDDAKEGSYNSHYNKKLDRCFVRFDFIDMRKEKLKERLWRVIVFDVFENRMIGEYSSQSSVCFVEIKECKTINEFQKLIRPYLEE